MKSKGDDPSRVVAEYVQRAQEAGARVELFSCWDRDQAAPPEVHSLIRPVDLMAPEFEFKEKQLVRWMPEDA
ncbi:hypothetical protein [Sorangium sp. So ce1335]|uniref:hypothetical protein n=1 Tax=Sorangium sp. So ce1335 TaxID=3133335 RepID=UPI003F60BE3E